MHAEIVIVGPEVTEPWHRLVYMDEAQRLAGELGVEIESYAHPDGQSVFYVGGEYTSLFVNCLMAAVYPLRRDDAVATAAQMGSLADVTVHQRFTRRVNLPTDEATVLLLKNRIDALTTNSKLSVKR